ncbi:protein kinase domain-containing protein [Ktedonobacter racemifer]|uniref:Serine/threonine protein kinase with FHA domain n=1 Tax=Ktedonobacter racemifer DSM 44963 TaxID=485913 RepID=D6U884_KTERA|nr:protein kinase [Ktedonobacter racemifer]EFH80095.1 serine/threonine protein kinase with FHA domain [Ktedonobacter racemifer DSM 44963]
MPGKIILTITAGPMEGKAFTFEEHDTLLCGRMGDCHVCLPDDRQISRHHFLLEVNPPDVRIRDLGSLHGTYINGQKYGGREKRETPEEGAKREYPQVDLHGGDEVKVGATVFHVRLEGAVASVEPVRCQRCGNKVSAEVGAAQQGAYVCARCREQVEQDPLALLMAVLDRAVMRDHRQQEIQIEDYEMGKLLGAGGMGAVYLAQHKRTREQAAVKVMLAKVRVSDDARRQFLREIETTRRLRHPHVVRFLSHGAEGSLFYFLLEYCAGGSVADLMKRRGGRLALEEARPIMLQALQGLAYLHEQGFVHRDLKPHNILLAGQAGVPVAKISDLGLAKNFEQAGLSGMTATGSYAGSFPFMPREQVINFKRVQPVSDVWAMGATCYTMLTGTFPRTHRRGEDPMLAILHGEIVPLRQRDPQFPVRLAEVIDQSLASKEGERFRHAGEMYEALVKASE